MVNLNAGTKPYITDSGWADSAKAFVLKLISDHASSNMRLVNAFFVPKKPANCLVLHKVCDMRHVLQLSLVDEMN